MRWLILILLVALLPSCATSGSHRQEVDPRDHPLGTGSVEFVGFEAIDLQDIRVIPEEGLELRVPAGDERIENVDGFWWRHDRRWFKIPDHCHTTITKGGDGQLQSSPACSKLGTRLQQMRSGLASPDWQDDSGATGHGTDYPF